jgi:hypothetical protein
VPEWTSFALGAFGSGGFSALGGYLLSGLNDRKRDERSAKREQDALAEQQASEGRAFQRDTLLELHDALHMFNRVCGQANRFDEETYRRTGLYGRDQLPGTMSDDLAQMINSINRLRVRIFDDRLRGQIDDYIKLATQRSQSREKRQEGDDAMLREQVTTAEREIATQYPILEEALGVAIRQQFPSYSASRVSARNHS